MRRIHTGLGLCLSSAALLAATALGTSLLIAQGLAPLERLRDVTFTGDVMKHANLSAVVLMDALLVAADDELRAVLVGRRVAPDTYDFGPPVALNIAPRPGDTGAEFDLEGLAVAGDHVIAVGSHSAVRTSADGANRKQAKNRERQREAGPRPDRDVLLRFRIDPESLTVAGEVGVASLRALITDDPILAGFGSVPGKENGIDIEGLAAEGDVHWVGFRGPTLRHGFAPVLQVSGTAAPTAAGLRFVSLGGRGIRDLLKVDGGFLVLAGPVGDGEQSEAIYWWDGRDCVPGQDAPRCAVAALGELPRPSGARAEGMALVADRADAYELLVVFDGVAGGAPGVYRASKPQR